MNGSDTESAIKTAYVAFQSWKERTAKVTQFISEKMCDFDYKYKAEFFFNLSIRSKGFKGSNPKII